MKSGSLATIVAFLHKGVASGALDSGHVLLDIGILAPD